jgi:TRAP-type C4-dicarboxylate transport system permease large subunit
VRPYIVVFGVTYVGLLALLAFLGWAFQARLQGEFVIVPAAMIALWRFFAMEKRNLEPLERRALLTSSWVIAVGVQTALSLFVLLLGGLPAGMGTGAAALVFFFALIFIAALYYGALWLAYGPLAGWYAKRLLGQ